MGISSAIDWHWFWRDAEFRYGQDADEAYNFLTTEVIPFMIKNHIPHEFVYDDVLITTNLVIPKDYTRAEVRALITAAGFQEKPMPSHDAPASADLKAALIGGADFNKRWH